MTATDASVLDGLRVVDFGQYIAGPLVALLLAEHGADVIRVDPPGGPMWDHPCNAVLQRSKRSVVLDLREQARAYEPSPVGSSSSSTSLGARSPAAAPDRRC